MDTRTKWNSKHKERMRELKEPSPNPRLRALSTHLKGGNALELACGLGGNSLYLARENYQVQAYDISDVAIHFLIEQAERFNLHLHPGICDLTELNNPDWRGGSFDLVVITYYLDRALFPLVKRILKEGGYFFMETYYMAQGNENSGISNQYKLQPKELLEEFNDWNVICFDENEQKGRQTIFCQKR